MYEIGRIKRLPASTRGDKLKSIKFPITSPVIHTEKLKVGSGIQEYDPLSDTTTELYSGRKPVSASSITCRAIASARMIQAIPHRFDRFASDWRLSTIVRRSPPLMQPIYCVTFGILLTIGKADFHRVNRVLIDCELVLYFDCNPILAVRTPVGSIWRHPIPSDLSKMLPVCL